MSQTNKNECKCSGSKTLDPNTITLPEATVDFIKIEKEDFTLYCFEGIDLTFEQIRFNITIAQKLLQKNDQLVISSQKSFADKLELPNHLNSNECVLEDKNFYTVISCKEYH